MASIIKTLQDKNLISPPPWLHSNSHYEVIMGSFAYGVSSDASDTDVYGFAIPPVGLIFPHKDGYLSGFDNNIPKFELYTQHHIKFSEHKEYDISIYNIVKYFRLCADCNPNMIDSLFVPSRCVLHMSRIGEMVRQNRKLFLSKKARHSFIGYAYSQRSQISNKKFTKNQKRLDDIEKVGYSTKFAYHLVRLMNECEQILVEGDMDLERNREQLKSIRRGEWTLEQIDEYFNSKEKQLEELYVSSTAVPNLIRETDIKNLLMNCLEEHYGNLDNLVTQISKEKEVILQIKKLVGAI